MAAESSPPSLPRGILAPAAMLGLLGVGLVVLLGPQWLDNPDLSHGIFAPIAFLLLLREARQHGTPRTLPPAWATILGAAFLSLGILGLTAGGMYAEALDWSHALVGFTLAASYSCLLLGTFAVFASRTAPVIPFNWSTIVAAGIWVLSAPIPPGTYTRLTLALQLWVSDNVLSALHLMGIAARQHGNVIELARTTVGVEEACSGVRSLVSCLFAGVFFSATLVRRPWARVLVIGLAAPLAIAMNFARSLTLTLLANADISIEGFWHDFTGYAVLGVTALALAGLAMWLGGNEAASPGPPPPSPVRTPHWVAAGLGAAVLMAGFFSLHRSLTPMPVVMPPDVEAMLPLDYEGWRVTTATELYQFREELRTDRLVQRTYERRDAAGVLQFTVYLAYWSPGQASASLVATHTPDACWPGGGWTAGPVASPRVSLGLPARTLPAAEQRFFLNNSYPQHVWFWHLYGGRPIPFINPLSPGNLLEIAARYGFRSSGEQMFIRASSNRPWSKIASEPLVAEIFSRLLPQGL